MWKIVELCNCKHTKVNTTKIINYVTDQVKKMEIFPLASNKSQLLQIPYNMDTYGTTVWHPSIPTTVHKHARSLEVGTRTHKSHGHKDVWREREITAH